MNRKYKCENDGQASHSEIRKKTFSWQQCITFFLQRTMVKLPRWHCTFCHISNEFFNENVWEHFSNCFLARRDVILEIMNKNLNHERTCENTYIWQRSIKWIIKGWEIRERTHFGNIVLISFWQEKIVKLHNWMF